MYDFSLFDLGLPLAGFVACLLMMGWWLGILVVAAILRWGQGAENLAWAAPFVLSPLCAVYYPVSTLPVWLKPVALVLPAAHVFEGLRGVMVARRYVMVDYDLPAELVDEAVALAPGIESPTISPLRDPKWVAVRVMVPRKGVNQVMDSLYAIGARAILVTAIHNARL